MAVFYIQSYVNEIRISDVEKERERERRGKETYSTGNWDVKIQASGNIAYSSSSLKKGFHFCAAT